MEKKYVIGIILGVIGVTGIILFSFSFRTIKSGEIGLKTRFGKIVDTSLKEGMNFNLPFIESIKKINIKVQKTELGIESSTKDLQIVNTNVAVNFRIDKDKASNLYKDVGKSYKETILDPIIKESVKSAIAQYNAEEITINRAEVSLSCLSAIQEKVKKYGIIIEDFNLTDFSFSDEYTKAIEEKQVAEQQVQTAKQNLEKAKVEAEKKLVEAKAQADANKALENTLTDEVLKKQFIEKWNGVLPTTYAGNDILKMFNLN